MLIDKSASDNPKGCAIPESPYKSMMVSIHNRSFFGHDINVLPSIRENTKITNLEIQWLK